MKLIFQTTLTGIILLNLGMIPVRAKSSWVGYDHSRNISLEFLTVQLKSEYGDHSAFSGGYFISCRIPISEGLRVIGELPVGHYAATLSYPFFGSMEISETGVGNPFIGLETFGKSGISGEFGLRLPLRGEENINAAAAALLSDVQRIDAFAYKTIPLKAMAHYRHSESNLHYRIRSGGLLMVDISGDRKESLELYFLYDGSIGYDGEPMRALVGLSGMFILTEDGDIEDRVLHTLDINLAVKLRTTVLGLLVKFPLTDSYSEMMSSSIGLTAEFGI